MKQRPIIFSGPMVRAIIDGRKTQTRRVAKPQPKHSPWTGYMCVPSKGYAIECGPDYPDDETDKVACPYGIPGDRLWVRETWRETKCDCIAANGTRVNRCRICHGNPIEDIRWRADYGPALADSTTWRQSIHMPRWASRITLELTGVRVEQLEDISEADAIAEGHIAVPAVQWYEGLKPLGDGTYARQQIRGSAPSNCKDVRPVCQNFDGNGIQIPCDFDPCARTAKELFIISWDFSNAKNGFGAATNPWVWVLEFKRV